MRTPAGKECKYYYQDFYRGRSVQECRLLDQARSTLPWEPKTCGICPVPDILRANGCENMKLEARQVRRFIHKRVEVQAFCVERKELVPNPYVGCGYCHPGASEILVSGGE